MDATTNLPTVVTLLVAVSVAAERAVEIIKNAIPFLNKHNDDEKKEGWRKTALQVMAVLGGIVTAQLARPAIEGLAPGSWSSPPGILALGLLASGGSGFWNSVLTYVLHVKDIKGEAVKKMRLG